MTMTAPAMTPQDLRDRLMIDTSDGPRPLANVEEEWQRADYPALDAALLAGAGYQSHGPRNAWLERPRGHVKTFTISTLVVWFLLASPFRRSGLVAASDEEQAGLLLTQLRTLLQLNPMLAGHIEVLRDRVRSRSTGSEVVVISSDVASSWGHTVQLIICEEISVWPKRDLFDSLFSTAAKRSDCAMICVGNAGWQDHWAWTVREQVRQDEAWYFSRLEGPMASWITAEALAAQERILPAGTYRRVWLNEWQPGQLGQALTADLIRTATTLGGPTHVPQPGFQYLAAADLGITRDSTAIAVLGVDVGQWIDPEPREEDEVPRWLAAVREAYPGMYPEPEDDREPIHIPGTGQIHLARLEVFTPAAGEKVRLMEVEQRLVDLHSTFNLQATGIDPWNAALLLERIREKGLNAFPVDFTAQNLRAMAQAVLDSFREQQIKLFDDPALLADLRALRVKETGFSFRLEAPRASTSEGTRHADTATALSIGLLLARRIDISRAASIVNGPLVCWP